MDLGMLLQEVWDQQAQYNLKVKQYQQRTSGEWAQTYLLGLISEVGELLTAMRWKYHKLEKIEDFGPNMGEELADITKYILSLWQLIEFTPQEMLEEIEEKGRFLEKVLRQDFEPNLQKRIAILDIDGVLADLDGTLIPFVNLKTGSNHPPNIHPDLANGWDFEQYREAKNLFESGGGYRTLQALYHIPDLFTALTDLDFSIVTYTARPVNVFRKIKQDTFQWFVEHGVMPDAIKFGRYERIIYAKNMMDLGHTVVLVDDDYITLARAASSGIPLVRAAKQSLSVLVGQIARMADEYEEQKQETSIEE